MSLRPSPAVAPPARAGARLRRQAGLAVLAAAALFAALLRPSTWTSSAGRARAQGEPTPIIEPLPQPKPIFLPLTVRGYKASAPDPLDSARVGYLTGMSSAGRQACRPGAYALLDKPEGRRDAKALAVLYAGPRAPNLDLYVGEAVKVTGALNQSPADCRLFTPWLLEVERIERIDLPPLGQGGGVGPAVDAADPWPYAQARWPGDGPGDRGGQR